MVAPFTWRTILLPRIIALILKGGFVDRLGLGGLAVGCCRGRVAAAGELGVGGLVEVDWLFFFLLDVVGFFLLAGGS